MERFRLIQLISFTFFIGFVLGIFIKSSFPPWVKMPITFISSCIISLIIGGILNPILRKIIDRIFNSFSKKQRLAKNLQILKNKINSLFVLGQSYKIPILYDEIKKLKHFFDNNFELLKIKDNEDFYSKWLNRYFVDDYYSNDPEIWVKEKKLYDLDKQKEMLEDLNKTKV